MEQNQSNGIEFETDSYKAVKFYDQTNAPKIVRLVMKYSGGAIKNETQAYYVLFGFVVVAIGVSLFLFFRGGIVQKPQSVPKFQEDIEPSVRAKLPPGVFETLPSQYD